MSILQQTLINFFVQIADKDDQQIKMIKQERCFNLTHQCWSFTLPALFNYLKQHHDAFTELNYRQFRKLMYSSAINSIVRNYGAYITILENKQHVDESRYALIWQEKYNGST